MSLQTRSKHNLKSGDWVEGSNFPFKSPKSKSMKKDRRSTMQQKENFLQEVSKSNVKIPAKAHKSQHTLDTVIDKVTNNKSGKTKKTTKRARERVAEDIPKTRKTRNTMKTPPNNNLHESVKRLTKKSPDKNLMKKEKTQTTPNKVKMQTTLIKVKQQTTSKVKKQTTLNKVKKQTTSSKVKKQTTPNKVKQQTTNKVKKQTTPNKVKTVTPESSSKQNKKKVSTKMPQFSVKQVEKVDPKRTPTVSTNKKEDDSSISVKKSPIRSVKHVQKYKSPMTVEKLTAIFNLPESKVKVKRLCTPSPRIPAVKRPTRSAKISSRKVKLLAGSPSSGVQYRKTPGGKRNLVNASSGDASPKLTNQKTPQCKQMFPFTPKPDDPYSILKQTLRNKVTTEICHSKAVYNSPQKITSHMARSLACTPSSSSNLPPTPKSSRKTPFISQRMRTEKISLRDHHLSFREEPRSSTPLTDNLSHSTSLLTMNDSLCSEAELSSSDMIDVSTVSHITEHTMEKSVTVHNLEKHTPAKKSYCTVM